VVTLCGKTIAKSASTHNNNFHCSRAAQKDHCHSAMTDLQ
jgi:hypothetical protein